MKLGRNLNANFCAQGIGKLPVGLMKSAQYFGICEISHCEGNLCNDLKIRTSSGGSLQDCTCTINKVSGSRRCTST